MTALIVFSAIFGVLGLLFHSEATRGVAFVSLGCLFAILARIAQAKAQHDELLAPRRQAQAAVPLTEAELTAKANRERLQVRGAYILVGVVVVLIVVQIVRAAL